MLGAFLTALPERRRSNIGSWRLSSRNGRRTHRRIIISGLSPRGTMIFVPAESGSISTVEMVTIDPQDLEAAQELDLNHGA